MPCRYAAAAASVTATILLRCHVFARDGHTTLPLRRYEMLYFARCYALIVIADSPLYASLYVTLLPAAA